MATDHFKGKKVYLVPLKVSDEYQKTIKTYIEEQGGLWISSTRKADLVLTTLRSSDRIRRHITRVKRPVVHTDWVMQCIKQQRWMDPKDYLIHVPREVIAISSDEDRPIPRQVNSWDELADTYEKRWKRKVSREEIIRGRSGRMPKRRCVEEDDTQHTSTTSDSSSDGSTSRQLSMQSEEQAKREEYQNKGYDCQRPVLLDYNNRELVEIFEFLEHARDLKGDMINSLSYRKAAAILKACPYEVKSGKDAMRLKGIGKKTARIIDDYKTKGRVDDIDMVKNDPQYQIMEAFYRVHGVGSTTAREWFHKGYKTLEDAERNEQLSKEQKLGIKYYHDFEQRLSRAQVEAIVAEFEPFLKEIDSGCEYTVCGSYSDVDIIMTHPDVRVSSGLLMKLLEKLQDKGFVTDLLSVGHEAKQGERETHDRPDLALCVWLPKTSEAIHRRVDLVVSPWVCYPLAVLGWTGSKQFERSIRLYGKREKAFKLTSHGLFDARTRERVTVKSERHVFELLGLHWLEPIERNC